MNSSGAITPQPASTDATRPIPATPISSSPTPIWTALAGGSFPESAPPIPDAIKAPAANHNSTSPELIGLRPSTFWSQSGIAKSRPNSPREMIIAASEPFRKDAMLNSPRSKRTLLPSRSRLRSQNTNITLVIAAMPRATGITEMPSSGQTKSPRANWFFGFGVSQP